VQRFPGWRSFPMVRLWEDSLRAQGWRLDVVEPLNILARFDGDPLFALLQAKGLDPEGKPMLPYVLVRGEAAVVVPECVNRETGERKLLMVRQRRVGDGSLSLEFPAGMVENGGDPADTALRELEEETGLDAGTLRDVKLERLWQRGLSSSPGLTDESVHFFFVEVSLDAARFQALEGGAAGHQHEGEHITTTLKTPAEAFPEVGSMLALIGLFLYQNRGRSA
jgi:ADP-sugar diphosphatase